MAECVRRASHPAPLSLLTPSDLARALSACSARCLARVEIALGNELGRELRVLMLHWLNWARLLSSEGGLTINAAWNANPGYGQASPQHAAVPHSSQAKDALRLVRRSVALAHGWKGLTPADFHDFASEIGRLDAAMPDGRAVYSGPACIPRLEGRAARAALVHFDVTGCFQDASWNALVDGFLHARRGAPRQVRSDSVRVSIRGHAVPLALTMKASDLSNDRDMTWGFVVDLDIDGMALPAPDNKALHLECVLCTSGGVRRSAAHLLNRFDATFFAAAYAQYHGMYRVCEARPFWSFAADANSAGGFVGHVASLEVHLGPFGADAGEAAGSTALAVEHAGEAVGGASFVVEHAGSAEWNADLLGTGTAPVVFVEGNEYAAKPFAGAALEGAIALVRRGGGCGFAQKALAAQAAGAVGCVVFRSDEDYECIPCMSQTFQGQQYPSPGIPSVIVGADVSGRLLAAATSGAGARARIVLDRSLEVMRQLSPDFRAFRQAAERGESIHVAVLAETVPRTFALL